MIIAFKFILRDGENGSSSKFLLSKAPRIPSPCLKSLKVGRLGKKLLFKVIVFFN